MSKAARLTAEMIAPKRRLHAPAGVGLDVVTGSTASLYGLSE